MENEISFFIDKPCNKLWDLMEDVKGGKYCLHCDKVVKDFTGMSNREIYFYYMFNRGGLCGRLSREQVDPGIEYVEPSDDISMNVGYIDVAPYKVANEIYVEEDLSDKHLDELNLERDYDFDLLFTNEKLTKKNTEE